MNELTIYDRVQSPEQFVAALGRHIARSGMFGCETEDQGCVLALECAARRMPPLSLSQRYHLIKGKLSMRADAMLGGFMQAGGKAEEIEFSPDAYEVELTRDRKKRKYRLTWEQVQQEPYAYEGREADVVKILAAGNKPKLKPKYSTPVSRSQMLRARCISNALRGPMGADIVAGYYAPEETEDFVDTTARVVDAKGPTMAEVAAELPEAEPVADVDLPTLEEEEEETEAEPAEQPTAEDAEIARHKATADAGMEVAKAAEEKLVGAGVEGSAKPGDEPCRTDQVNAAKKIFDRMTEEERGFTRKDLLVIVAEYGGERVSKLSSTGCEKLIGRLHTIDEVFKLADEVSVPADTLKGVVRKAGVENVWELPPSLLTKLAARLAKTKAERAKN